MGKSNDTDFTNHVIKKKKDSKNKNDEDSISLEHRIDSLLRYQNNNLNDSNKYDIQDMNHS